MGDKKWLFVAQNVVSPPGIVHPWSKAYMSHREEGRAMPDSKDLCLVEEIPHLV